MRPSSWSTGPRPLLVCVLAVVLRPERVLNKDIGTWLPDRTLSELESVLETNTLIL